MARASDILGINARSAEYLVLNKKNSRKIADSKSLTKNFFEKAKIPSPMTLGTFSSIGDIEGFDYAKLDEGFVVKPVEGLGGEGILVVKKASKKEGEWIMMDGSRLKLNDLKLHIRDIVEGRFSRNNLADTALMEERVKIHPIFSKFAVGGTPDVRVIVFNKVPVMAMLRVPTSESKGKSNLHQGAIGLGLDIATGITTYGVYRNQPIKYFPNTTKKVNGIPVPFWTRVLETAVKIQFKRPGLAYFGCDILIDKEKGPVVIEINDQPGLSIQLANRAGLRRRLDRVEGLEIDTIEKGVKVARALFAAKFANRVGLASEKQVIGIFEKVLVKPHKGKRVEIAVKIDTGAKSSSIDKTLAEELGLLLPEHILWEKKYKSSLGEETRKVIALDFKLKGRRVKARASITNRKGLRRRMIIGRGDLREFVVDPSLVRLRKK
jgi:alpha-L-glutamate ligase-like protein